MLLKSIAVCSLILNVQTQQNYQYPLLLNEKIYFEDNRPVYRPGNDQLQQSLPVIPLNRIGGSVEVENNNEVSATSSYGTERQKPSGQTAQALGGQIPLSASGQFTQTNGQAAQGQALAPNTADFNNILYSVTDFGLKMLNGIHQSGNVVVSPYSIAAALALLQQGARGATQDQITAALQITPTDSISSFAKINADFESRSSRNVLKTACNVFVADGFTLNPGFKAIAKKSFYSDITQISFSRPEPAAKYINSWVASRTNNKIEKLVTPESLDSTTQVVLVNAVYFKGLWEIPFRVQSTKSMPFHLSNGAKLTVPFMSTRRYMKAGLDLTTGAKITILPFERTQYTLMLILPSTLFGVSQTLDQMSDARLLSYHSFPALETSLHVPKFTVQCETDLVQVLRKMGITNMFGPTSDLSGLGSYQTDSPQISAAVHSAVLSIDEEGGSAAAATSFAAVALSNDEPSMVFTADRPFIAVLWDETTSLPLFMAKIEDPSQRL